MYPDKVGRLVIDGVFDANDYLTAQWATNLDDTDAVLSAFFTFCHQAGPSKCPLYAPSAAEIRDRVQNILDGLLRAPIPVPFTSRAPAVLTKKVLHQFMFRSLYSPIKLFPVLADGFAAIETNNLTTLTNITDAFLDLGVDCACERSYPWLENTWKEGFHAIACGDGDKVPNAPGDYEAFFRNLTAKSSFASPIWGIHHMECAEWKISAKWRYNGPFAGNTSYPLLIIAPTFDPVTPLKHAKAVQKRYAGSALLIQNSYGHTSIESPSLCTAKNVRAYFTHGTLPTEGTVCEVDELPFIGEVGGVTSALSSEETELLETFKGLATVS